MKYFDKWMKDIRRRLEQYQNQEREPYGYVKTYFVDSGLFFIDLIELYPDNENIDIIWDWLYHLGSLFAKYVSTEYFDRFNKIRDTKDMNNCNNTIQQMYIVFKAMHKYKIQVGISIFSNFYERVGGFFKTLKEKVKDREWRSLVLYGCCISIQCFRFFLTRFDETEGYHRESNRYYKNAITVLKQYMQDYDIFEDLSDSFGLWSFIFKTINENSEFLDVNQIPIEKLEEKMIEALMRVTKFKSIPYVLDNSRDTSEMIFNKYIEKQIELLDDIIYTGSYWSQLTRFAKAEFYIEIYKKSDNINDYLKNFPPFYPEEIPQPLFNKFLETFLRIMDLIESDSTLKRLIRNKKYVENDFRDFFKTKFDYDKEWFVIDEFKGRLDYYADLKVGFPQTTFRITTEFKIWKRNFEEYEPVQELLDRMGNYDRQGIIFMLNPNKNQINEKLKIELIYEHPRYYPGSYEEIKIESRLFPIFKAIYKYEERLIEIYHIILDLFTFIRSK